MGLKYRPIDLLGGYYRDDALPWSAQDTVNWLPVVAEVSGTRTPTKLRTPPGLKLFGTAGTQPVRGMHNVEGRLFVVAGTTLYEISTSGAATSRGTIPGVGRVSMAHNQVEFGNQLLVVNGDAGYVWNTSSSTFTKITDEGFPGSVMVDYVSQFLVQVEPFGRFWFHSEVADALNYNTLDRYSSEASPDKIVGIVVSQFEVMVFNERTCEFFANTGALTGTFQSKQITIDRGCASRASITKLTDAVFWLGDDGAIYMRPDAGYQAVRVSTRPLERAIANLNWADAFGFAWEDEGHKVYYLTFPDGQTWGYDLSSQLWHRRQSHGFKRWRLNMAVEFNGKWIGGDFQNGNLYELDWGTYHENGEPMVSERTSGVTSSDQNRVKCQYVELLFDTGTEGPSVPVIVGDVPNGNVGEAITGTYVVSGGIAPYGPITVLSGTFPPGITLDPDGSFSGTFTTVGTFSWVVGGEDAFGQPFSTQDIANVTATPVVTWDAANKGTDVVLSGGDLSAQCNSFYQSVSATLARSSGQYQYEFTVTEVGGTNTSEKAFVGLAIDGADLTGNGMAKIIGATSVNNSIGYGARGAGATNSGFVQWWFGGSGSTANTGSGNSLKPGDVMTVAVNLDADSVTFYLNGASMHTQALPIGQTWRPACSVRVLTGVQEVVTANFGASPLAFPVVGYLAWDGSSA